MSIATILAERVAAWVMFMACGWRSCGLLDQLQPGCYLHPTRRFAARAVALLRHSPGTAYEIVDAVLSALRPLCIVLLTNANRVTEQTSDIFHRSPMLQQMNSERVTQTMGQHVAIARDTRCLEAGRDVSLSPITGRTLRLADTRPKEVVRSANFDLEQIV